MKKFLAVAMGLAFAACTTQPKNPTEASNPEPARNVAESEQLGRPVYLNNCQGKITLNQADNNALSIQLEGVNTSRCSQLTVSDSSSKRVIKSYDIKGTSYTLSKEMLKDLSQDCQVDFRIHSQYGSSADRFIVYIPWCRPSSQSSNSGSGLKSYQLSNNGNCKLMLNGNYSGSNVDSSYCSGARGNDVVSYEWSNKNNCKRMINGDYSNQNVSDKYCR